MLEERVKLTLVAENDLPDDTVPEEELLRRTVENVVRDCKGEMCDVDNAVFVQLEFLECARDAIRQSYFSIEEEKNVTVEVL